MGNHSPEFRRAAYRDEEDVLASKPIPAGILVAQLKSEYAQSDRTDNVTESVGGARHKRSVFNRLQNKYEALKNRLRPRKIGEAAFAAAATVSLLAGTAHAEEVPRMTEVATTQVGEPMFAGYSPEQTGNSPIIFSDGIGGGKGLSPTEFFGRVVVGVPHPGTALNVGGDIGIPGVGTHSLGETVAIGAENMKQEMAETGATDIRGYSAGGMIVQEVLAASSPDEIGVIYATEGGSPYTNGGLGHELTNGPLRPLKPLLDMVGLNINPDVDNSKLGPNVRLTQNEVYGDPYATGIFDDNGNLLPIEVILNGLDAHYGITELSPYDPGKFRIDETYTTINENGAEITHNRMYTNGNWAPAHEDLPAFTDPAPSPQGFETPIGILPVLPNAHEEAVDPEPAPMPNPAEAAIASIQQQANDILADTTKAYEQAIASVQAQIPVVPEVNYPPFQGEVVEPEPVQRAEPIPAPMPAPLPTFEEVSKKVEADFQSLHENVEASWQQAANDLGALAAQHGIQLPR